MTETDAIYARAGTGGELGIGERPALLVIDLSLGFTDPTSPVGADMTETVQKVADLADALRGHGVPVVFTTIAYRSDLADGGLWPQKIGGLRHLVRGTRWAELDDRLRARDEDVVIEKQFASAFFGTPLASLLAARGVDTVLVAGATTSGCVRASAVDALQYGFRVTVVEDCVTDRAPEPHAASLFDLAAKYADVLPARDVLARIARG